jgi:hypothetical protein
MLSLSSSVYGREVVAGARIRNLELYLSMTWSGEVAALLLSASFLVTAAWRFVYFVVPKVVD